MSLHRITSGLLFATLLLGACSSERNIIGFEDAGSSPPSFTPPSAEAGAEATDAGERALCISAECPAPYATCGSAASLFCATNLKTDPDNCGACGVSCSGFARGLYMNARCVEGACVFECISTSSNAAVFRDCNGILDDGCESNVAADEINCGVCGHSCGPGVPCIEGKCGCAAGKTNCAGECVDTRFDPSHCGACNHECEDPEDACDPMPANTIYGCGNSTCGQFVCLPWRADCNEDLNLGCASDGCETDLRKNLTNCGGCGIVCAPGQECRDEGNGPECLDTCASSNLAQCATGCRDLRSDILNCGACGYACPDAKAHQLSVCRKGECTLECAPGFGDCNADPSDGCEIDLRSHPAHCGACGHECDIAAGQPCIESQCLMAPCDAGVTTK